jgi:hypothetical protein
MGIKCVRKWLYKNIFVKFKVWNMYIGQLKTSNGGGQQKMAEK